MIRAGIGSVGGAWTRSASGGFAAAVLGGLAAVAMAIAIAAIAAPTAEARDSYALDASFDFGGQFGADGPGMMAMHEASDTLYVVDPSNSRILQFNVSDPAAPVAEDFSALGQPAITQADGQALVLGASANIAVDNSGGPQDGTIYLATNTAADSRAEAFSPSGAWLYEFRHDAQGAFDPSGTPQPGRAIGVARSGPRAGEIYRFGLAGTDSAAYLPAPVAGAPPELRVSGGPAFVFGTPHSTFFWDGGSEIVFANGGFSFAARPLDAATLTDSGPTATYQFPTGTTDMAPADVYRQMFVRRTASGGSLALIEQTGLGFQNPPRILDEFAVGTVGTGTGMLHGADADRLYVSDGTGGEIDIYGPAPAPDAAMLETGYVDPTTARLRAEVDPLGLDLSSCEFQWGTTTNYGNTAPCDVIPSGDGGVEVSADVTVVTRTNYHSRVRVAADNGTVTSSPDLAWQAPDLPEAATLSAGPQQRTGTAVLGGTVDANQTQAGYHIEYSTDPGLADSQRFPADVNADAGHGDSPQRVFQVVDGLEPGTTYYFRLAAETKAGSDLGQIESFRTFEQPSEPQPDICQNAEFRTGPSRALPDCRAWEKISPDYKNGGSINQSQIVAAPDGKRVTFGAMSSFAGQQDPGFGATAMYLAERDGERWGVRGISPGLTVPIPQGTGMSWSYSQMTPDLSRLIGAIANVDLPGSPTRNTTAYIWDTAAGKRLPLVVAGTASTGSSVVTAVVGISDAGSSGYLQGFGLPVESGPSVPAGQPGLYWWADGEGLRLASTMPQGTPATGVGLGANAVSRDGEKLLWQVQNPPGRSGSREVYVSRRDGATLWASEAQGTAQPSVASSTIVAWTPNLRYVLFRAGQKLTADSTAQSGSEDLYRFDTETGELVDLTTDDASGAGAQAVVHLSDDGERVYFVASGNLASGATGSGPKLYGWDDGEIRFITDYHTVNANSDDSFLPSGVSGMYERTRRISDDGRYLLFSHSGSVAGTRMDSVYDTGGNRMLYRYDWDEDRIDCVTCHPEGVTATSDAYLTMPSRFRPGGAGPGAAVKSERYFLSNDGVVMFATMQRLVSADVNNGADTYLWDGDLRLITSGKARFHEWAETATPDFEDIYVLSARQLVASDVDGDADLYVAKVGGGIAAQQVRPSADQDGCEGEACQGVRSDSPPLPRLDSTAPSADPPANRCATRRAAFRRSAKRLRTRRAGFRKARRSARVSVRRHRRLRRLDARGAEVGERRQLRARRRAVRSKHRLRRQRVALKRVAKQHRRSKAALVRCRRGDS